jgi:hypothetical protein
MAGGVVVLGSINAPADAVGPAVEAASRATTRVVAQGASVEVTS